MTAPLRSSCLAAPAGHAKSSPSHDDELPSSSTTTRKPSLSTRGSAHASTMSPFWSVFDDMLRDVYQAEKNPDGIINMGIANNSLMEKDLLSFFSANLKLDPTDLTYGTSLYGSTRLFNALAKHYNGPAFSPAVPVRADQILTGPGCGSLLDQVFEHIADAGDSVLLSAPYYNGFDADLSIRAGVKCVPVFSTLGDGSEDASFTGETALRGFEEALLKTLEAGSKVKATIVCNPQNPLGRCYDRRALLSYGRFAEKHNLHLVFDEIYAMSVFPTSDNRTPQPFISALNIDWQSEASCDPSRIHILSSASKDFGLNGFRIGTFISQHNAELFAAMKVTTKLYMVSSPADALFSALIEDTKFYDWFVETNRKRLTAAYEVIKKWCIRHKIDYKPSNAGHFVLVDLSRFLVEHSGQEVGLWSKVLQHRVAITPGSNYHCVATGWFRITFSMEEAIMMEGLCRLEKALGLQTLKRSPAVEGDNCEPLAKKRATTASVDIALPPVSLATPTWPQRLTVVASEAVEGGLPLKAGAIGCSC
ncbi:unnamed protein product [Sympodiomycopsis kandeliae]